MLKGTKAMPDTNKEDGFFDQVSAMAERLGLTDDDRAKYVHDHMTRAGYKMVPSYILEDEGQESGSDFFRRPKANASGGKGKSKGGWFPE
jgi:hypothetical protein